MIDVLTDSRILYFTCKHIQDVWIFNRQTFEDYRGHIKAYFLQMEVENAQDSEQGMHVTSFDLALANLFFFLTRN